MVYDNDHYHASALLHNKKKGAADVTWKLTGCSSWRAYCQHPALHPSRHVEPLPLNDRFHLYPQRAYYLLVIAVLHFMMYLSYNAQDPICGNRDSRK
ncbi:hypothetical protein T12_7399 [Trichinella patagoniensis]|uniref:Uncharacterized protein n=1 Tax=Trichinella patagoniensis TaxID=990121 RepID=A0A0V0ZDF7_9BILA|nr:hypothetical protein T12_7399 [Trichinella patagoniensis]